MESTMKYCFGPMTVNITNAIINWSNDNNVCVGFIPSRRQIDYNGGYVGFTTESFCEYVRSKSKITLERDHGGPLQGVMKDSGDKSLDVDAQYFDIIHIDPFKQYPNIVEAARYTANAINRLIRKNPRIKFEVGTEENIYKYQKNDLNKFLDLLVKLTNNFSSIEYVAVQTGCQIRGLSNKNSFNSKKISKTLQMCNQYGLKTKEHNGDFLTGEDVKKRIDIGIDCINIAPELGIIETAAIIRSAGPILRNDLIAFLVKSNKWKKWLPYSADDYSKAVFSGHYMSLDKEFILLRNQISNLDTTTDITNFLNGIINA